MWTCALQLADDCIGEDLYDPDARVDGQPACLRCAPLATPDADPPDPDYPITD